ncbi:hypothetical protein U1872_06445 [Sphingomonas sp. RB3P16]
MSVYQELRDADIAEAEIEQKIGEGWTLDMIRAQAVEDGYLENE